jgi:small subunit ribosomal protein S14
MAKKSSIARDAKRLKMIEQYAEKRAELKRLGDLEGLAKLPRNSSPTRRTNRCIETGRSRGYMRQFGLRRNTRRNEVELVRRYIHEYNKHRSNRRHVNSNP